MHSDASSDFCDRDEQDEVCSCDTYSSGWERSSTTEYLDSTDTEEEEVAVVDRFYGKDDFYVPLRSTGATKIFDMEYKCDLIVLPHPYRRNQNQQYKEEEKQQEQSSQEEEEEIQQEPVNPWKKVEPSSVPPEDPWKFLEAMKEETKKPHTREMSTTRPPHAKRSTPIDNSNTNKLCKYKGDCRMKKNNHCTMVHALSEWKPRICRFNHTCKRKRTCGYYHTDTPVSEYLRTMIQTKNTIYADNAALYEKYL